MPDVPASTPRASRGEQREEVASAAPTIPSTREERIICADRGTSARLGRSSVVRRRRNHHPCRSMDLDWVARVAGARHARRGARLQSLWDGYGDIVRVELDGGDLASVIVKRVTPPPRPKDD